MRRALCLGALLAGCAGPAQVVVEDDAAPHLGDAWFDYRGPALGLSAAEARRRDAALSTSRPPEGLDALTRREAALLWRDLCASCHGPEGRGEGAPPFETPPRAWGGMGARMGFFFGGDAMRAGVYRRIAQGGETEGSPMPGWADTLAREQIWALVRHIEGF